MPPPNGQLRYEVLRIYKGKPQSSDISYHARHLDTTLSSTSVERTPALANLPHLQHTTLDSFYNG